MKKSKFYLHDGIRQNWVDTVCLDTELVVHDGSVKVNFALLQMFNGWKCGGNVILLPDYSIAEVYDFSFKLYQTLDTQSHDDSGLCDISVESDQNNSGVED